MRYTITDYHRDQLSASLAENNPHARIDALADAVLEIAEANDIEDIDEFASHIATHEIVGTGMGMKLSEVFEHLSDLAAAHGYLDIPSHGGDEELLGELTLDERLDHNAYYALQTLYGNLISEELSDRQESE